MIKKMKPCRIENPRRSFCSLGTEKNASREDALEPVHEPPVMETVLWQLQEFKHLGSAFEANGAAFLFHRERGNPYGDETVLAEGQTEIGMSNDFEEELPILAAMNQLGRRGTTQGDAAEHEGPGTITDLLSAFFSLLSDKGD